MNDEFYINFVKHIHPGCYVYLKECSICGNLTESGYYPNRSEGYDLSVIHPTECVRCNNIFSRNPEIFEWVLSVVAKSKLG